MFLLLPFVGKHRRDSTSEVCLSPNSIDISHVCDPDYLDKHENHWIKNNIHHHFSEEGTSLQVVNLLLFKSVQIPFVCLDSFESTPNFECIMYDTLKYIFIKGTNINFGVAELNNIFFSFLLPVLACLQVLCLMKLCGGFC